MDIPGEKGRPGADFPFGQTAPDRDLGCPRERITFRRASAPGLTDQSSGGIGVQAEAIGRAGIAAIAVTTVALAAWAPTPGYALAPTMTLSATSGPSGGGNPITATATSASALLFPVGTRPTVQFQYSNFSPTTCSAQAQAVTQIDGTATTLTAGVVTADPSTVRRLSTTKVAFNVPAASYPATVAGSPSTINTGGLALLYGQNSSKWNICVYDSDSTTTSNLLANATYTLALRPMITSILPTSSPSFGGQSISVSGVGFGPTTTASIDGAPLTDLVVSANGDSFTATTSAHASGTGYPVTVKTIGGIVISTDPDNNGLPQDGDPATPDAPILFGFDNSILVAPSTASIGTAVNLDVHGTGLDALNFDSTAAPTATSAHIFLVRDAYDPSANRGVQECTDVLLVSGTELVCTLDLSADRLDLTTSAPVVGSPITNGTYTVTIVANGSTSATADEFAASTVASGATFTVAPH